MKFGGVVFTRSNDIVEATKNSFRNFQWQAFIMKEIELAWNWKIRYYERKGTQWANMWKYKSKSPKSTILSFWIINNLLDHLPHGMRSKSLCKAQMKVKRMAECTVGFDMQELHP